MASLILLNKPFNTLCQFTDTSGRATLAQYINSPQFADFYPAGRLDFDSEGLVALTNSGELQHRLADPKFKLPKTYWVQVEGDLETSSIEALIKGPILNDGPTRPCKVRPIAPPNVWARNPPIRNRESIPTFWLEIIITEGRNRQVRRMTAAVGLPTLRLIRAQIGEWTLGDLTPGEFRLETVNLPSKSTSNTRLKPSDTKRDKNFSTRKKEK